ncbi:MAG: polyprenyl synthetase family protein [Proteobacteria bacterium]|nr:polyprenyl synthetase family protein [Pseudomonadota bacterium]
MGTAGGSKFEDRLQRAAAAVERRLEEHLARAAADGTPERLLAAMRHAVLAGGKRFRPFLVIETARIVSSGDAGDLVLDVAAALECVHAYSLVHDDLPAMDNDELRRGLPTVWKAFDEWTAILAGDALLTLAFEIAAGKPSDVERLPARLRIVGGLARASGGAGMVGGQVLDLESEKLGLPRRPDEAHVRRLQAMKTGALIAFAAEAGAIAGGGDEADISRARGYGEALGLAFQISDDLLDVTGDAAVVGKAVGKDQALGKATLVALAGIEAAQGHLDDAIARAIGAVEVYGARAEGLAAAARFLSARRH